MVYVRTFCVPVTELGIFMSISSSNAPRTAAEESEGRKQAGRRATPSCSQPLWAFTFASLTSRLLLKSVLPGMLFPPLLFILKLQTHKKLQNSAEKSHLPITQLPRHSDILYN